MLQRKCSVFVNSVTQMSIRVLSGFQRSDYAATNYSVTRTYNELYALYKLKYRHQQKKKIVGIFSNGFVE
jgi:hypothetical protein